MILYINLYQIIWYKINMISIYCNEFDFGASEHIRAVFHIWYFINVPVPVIWICSSSYSYWCLIKCIYYIHYIYYIMIIIVFNTLRRVWYRSIGTYWRRQRRQLALCLMLLHIHRFFKYSKYCYTYIDFQILPYFLNILNIVTNTKIF